MKSKTLILMSLLVLLLSSCSLTQMRHMSAQETAPKTDSDEKKSRDASCDDGTLPTCGQTPPSCPDGYIVALKDNCFTCAQPGTCKEL